MLHNSFIAKCSYLDESQSMEIDKEFEKIEKSVNQRVNELKSELDMIAAEITREIEEKKQAAKL